MIGMAWIRNVDPSKCSGQNIGSSFKVQDSTFSILVIQDHIESIGKPILLKGDEVFLNGLLAQNVSGMLQKPSTTF